MALFGVVAASAFSDPMVFDRGLPTANLNNAAGANRSNVAWSNGNSDVSGDDFTIGATGETWIVTGIRTWTTEKLGLGSGFHLGDEYSDVSLYTGTGGVSLVATGTLTAGSDVNSNPNITHTQVQYAGGLDYQRTGGAYSQIYQNDFTNLNLSIAGGVKYYFAVDGTPRSPSTDYWFNHASNAALSGSTQQGADNLWLVWSKSGLANPPTTCDSNGPIAGVCNGGWDKSSDINVQVFAHKFAPPPPALSVGGTTNLETGGPQSAGAVASQSNSSSALPDAALPVALIAVAGIAAGGWYVRRRLRAQP